MKVSVIFVYPMVNDYRHYCYAIRFLESYRKHPPCAEHESIVVLNNGKATDETKEMFSLLPNLRFIERDDSGYDIGAYQHAAKECDSDLAVFFNTSVFINNDCWLLKMIAAQQRHGDAQYGCMGNRGDIDIGVWPHIRTTAFWMNPKLFLSYPKTIIKPEDRHPFEHGRECFTEWLRKRGIKSWVVTKRADYLWANWDDDPNGYQRGDQSSLLCGDRMCEKPYFKHDNQCRAGFGLTDCKPWSHVSCLRCLFR